MKVRIVECPEDTYKPDDTKWWHIETKRWWQLRWQRGGHIKGMDNAMAYARSLANPKVIYVTSEVKL